VTWLTPGGVAAALLVGAGVAWGVGWPGLVPLFAFLLSGSLLTRLTGGQSTGRNVRQVAANGGVAAVAALLGSWPAVAGGIAAATADTWATEIGAFSPSPPRLITTGTRVAPGRSGGVTALGSAGGVAGATLIAVVSGLVAPALRWRGVSIAVGAGILGMLADSVLGATLQARWACPGCGAEAERPGACHGERHLARGIRWLDNDAVNLAGSLCGAIAAAAVWSWWN
jgi:uncharacterized protein (TIGR00297 family)